jgi:hypothetical protein
MYAATVTRLHWLWPVKLATGALEETVASEVGIPGLSSQVEVTWSKVFGFWGQGMLPARPVVPFALETLFFFDSDRSATRRCYNQCYRRELIEFSCCFEVVSCLCP